MMGNILNLNDKQTNPYINDKYENFEFKSPIYSFQNCEIKRLSTTFFTVKCGLCPYLSPSISSYTGPQFEDSVTAITM